jgi:DNA-binding response OmpR family regulator/tetratricopeptide (TPR) repeat protein
LEVLIVEDNRALARSLGQVLEQAGYQCRQVHDGIAALEAVGKAAPDLILIDLLLPKKDGQSVIATLAAAEATRSIPIIAMSGVFRGADPAKSVINAGAKAFLEKPFETAELLDRVSRLIGRPMAIKTEAPRDAIDLAKAPAIEVLWSAMQLRTSGAVHFELAKRHKVVVLDAGRPFAVRSNLARESLGRRLRESGLIDEQVFEAALRQSKATGKRQGEILIQMGAIGERELAAELAAQAGDKLLEIFSWSEGRSWTQVGVRAMSLSSELSGWTPRRAVLQGAGRVNAAVIAKRLEPFLECDVSQESLHLEDGENESSAANLFEAVARPQPVRSLVSAHGATLYALWMIGALDLRSDRTVPNGLLPGVGPSAAAVEIQGRLNDALASFEGADHFKVLGLDTNASDDEVRKAFMALAKVYHPDKISRRAPELLDLAGKVFARIAEAHDALGNPDSRASYTSKMRSSRDASLDRAAVGRILTAEQQFRRAEEALRRKEWDAALECLRWALELDPDEGEFHSLRGWATFLKQQDQGESTPDAAILHLKKGIALAPQSPSGYFYLGQIRKACGDAAEAERMFRKTIEVRPKHVEALREIRLLQLRRAKGEDTIAGRLFGRKKK